MHGFPRLTADPNNDEPTTINLATGANYAGIQTFPDQSQAQAVAQQIGECNQRSGWAPAAPARRRHLLLPGVTRLTPIWQVPMLLCQHARRATHRVKRSG